MNELRKPILDLDLLSAGKNTKTIRMSLSFFRPKKTLFSLPLSLYLSHSVVCLVALYSIFDCVLRTCVAGIITEYGVTWSTRADVWLILSVFALHIVISLIIIIYSQ